MSNESKTVSNSKRSRKGKGGRRLRNDTYSCEWSMLSDPFPFQDMKHPDNQVHRIVRSVDLGLITATNVAASVFASLNFTLSQIDDVASLKGVWDQYRIDLIEVWLFVVSSGSTSSALPCTPWYTVVDYDDSTALTTVGQALDYENCQMSILSAGQYRRFKPHMAVAAYQGAFTGYTNLAGQWIDAAYDTVQHYGVKIAAEATALGALNIYGKARFHVSFRNSR